MTTLAPPPAQITPHKRFWTVLEYHEMAYPTVFGPDERLELIEGEIFFRGTDVRRPFTLEDYRRLRKRGLVQEGDQIDLVDGKGVPYMSPMGQPHAIGVSKTGAALETAFGPGHVVWSQSPAAVSKMSEPEPDVLVTSGTADDFWEHPPTPSEALVLVEVSVSSLRQDRGRKAEAYAKAGVADYWIVNVTDRTLEVRRLPENGGYRSLTVYNEGDSAAPLAAPDSPVRVSDLLPLKRPQ